MAGTILGYVGIVGAVAVLIAAILLGDEINSTFDAQGTETTTSVASITTTTFPWQGWLDDIEARNAEDARVALLFWAVPHVGSARRWAESAVEYAEALDRRSDDREEAISSLLALGLSVCRQLVAYESDNVGGSPRSPAQVEADMRDTLGLEGWELLGPVWYESLVYGLCVR